MKPTLALHKLPLYNTGRLDDSDIIAAFAARQNLFDRIITDIGAEKEDSRAQHHLIVGQRGMGKTMLLSRIAAEIRTSLLGQQFIPLSFAEEQYAVDRLSKFWLNCLDSLADAQERAGNQADAARIDDIVKNLSTRLPGASKDDSPLAREALAAFLDAAASLKRRPVLLVDNLQLVFERISSEQQHALRELLMRPGCPILIGASPSPPPESQDYGAAFYDHFKVHYLRPLEVEEMQALMLHLADAIGREDVRSRIVSHPHRLQVLRQLTGGNPRTTATLFFLYAEDFAPTVFGDLENLLDRVTPLYKARFEELSAQQQVIASAIANHWDPVTSRTLSEITGLPMTGISGQLDRLEKTGFIERVTLFGQSSTGYQISERFFNVWFLMRSASRRQRREVEFLTRFIENFYESDDRSRIAKLLLNECNFSPDRHLFTKALAATLDNKAFAEDLERHAQLDALRQKAAESRRKLDEILDLSSLPPATLSFNELREKLMALVPENACVAPEHFAEIILSDRKMFMSREREKMASRHAPLTDPELDELIDASAKQKQLDDAEFGVSETLWLQGRLSRGLLSSFLDVNDWIRSLSLSPNRSSTLMLLKTMPDGLGMKFPIALAEKTLESLNCGPTDSWEAWLESALIAFSKFSNFPMALQWLQKAKEMIENENASFSKMVADALQKANSERGDEDGTLKKSLDDLISHRLTIVSFIHEMIAEIYSFDQQTHELAEAEFKRAISLVPCNAMILSRYGAFLAEFKNRSDEAKEAYLNALDLSPDFEFDFTGMVFLIRDVLGESTTARQLLARYQSTKKKPDHELIQVETAIFHAYDQNWGLASQIFSSALDQIPGDFSISPHDGWMRISAVIIHRNYGEKFLSLLEHRGDHVRFRPWYEALKALHLGDRGHLLNIAPEIRTTAEALYDAIKERLDKLPESTRRRPLPKAVKKRGKRR